MCDPSSAPNRAGCGAIGKRKSRRSAARSGSRPKSRAVFEIFGACAAGERLPDDLVFAHSGRQARPWRKPRPRYAFCFNAAPSSTANRIAPSAGISPGCRCTNVGR